MRTLVLALAASLCASVAVAADHLIYAPPQAWVQATPIPLAAPSTQGAAVQVLLSSQQSRYGADGDEFFTEVAFKILSPQALSFPNILTPTWNPETDTVTFHRFNIVRGGQVIDLLGGGSKVTVVRRETNLQLAMLDGDLTASVQPEGLQVGDVVDFAITLTRKDPVLKGRSQGFVALPAATSASRFLVRQLWPADSAMRWKVTEGMPAPVVTQKGAATELVIDADNAEAPKPPSGAPWRFANLAQLQLSDFQTWAEVSALMAPLYDKAAHLAPDSPLRAEAKKIAGASTDPKVRAEMALRLVQDQVRYAFIGMNLGGYVPADADLTWTRRFGDCKGKTALLLALLHELGIEAEPALANAAAGDQIADRLPVLDVFDHVLVRAKIGGRVYWLDGTRSGDRAIDDIAVPDLHWVLPVRATGAQLEKLEPAPLAEPAFEVLLKIDASAGLDAPAVVHAEHVFRGDAAVERNIGLTADSPADAQRSLREYWRREISWADPKTVDFAFDDAHRLLRLTFDGSGKPNWERNGDYRDLDLGDSNLGFRATFKREPGPNVDAPFSVGYPTFDKWTDVVVLPQKGQGFTLLDGAPVSETLAGWRYERTSRIEDGVLTMTATERSLAPEIPAADAQAAAEPLRQLVSYDVTIRAPASSAPVTEAPDETALPVAPPKTAEDFDLRGETYLLKRDFPHAIADFDQSARLDPSVAKTFYNRGVAELEGGNDAKAIGDFNHALQLNPKDVTALEGRAEYFLLKGDEKSAEADFDAAARLSPDDKTILYRHAKAFEDTGRFEGGVRVYDRIVAAGPTVGAYDGRCWMRAEWGHELQEALSDCNTALKLQPETPQVLDSRGLVNLRLGRLDDAIADYDEAVRQAPEQAASFFGRGIAESRKGRADQSAADLSKARTLDPKIDATFLRMGVKP